MRLYIAGPMTGYPQFNIPAFDEMAALLREQGYDVVSPAELDDPEIRAISLLSPDGNIDTLTTHGQSFGDFLARDVKMLADDGIDSVVVLPGWAKSRGARLETFVANAICGLDICVVKHYKSGGVSLMRVPPLYLIRAWAGTDELFLTSPLHRDALNAFCGFPIPSPMDGWTRGCVAFDGHSGDHR
jgi:hypothetical protein